MQNTKDSTVMIINHDVHERLRFDLDCHAELKVCQDESKRCCENEIDISRDIKFKMNTSTEYTILSAKSLFGDLLTEEEFIEKFKPLPMCTFTTRDVDGRTHMKFYKLQLTDFKIGTLELGSVPVWVTFDYLMYPLLGRDLLGMLNITIMSDYNIVYLEKTEKLKAYQEKVGNIVEFPYFICLYSKDDEKDIDAYMDDLEAYKARVLSGN